MKDSGIKWISTIPDTWNVIKVKYNCSLKGRIGWQGLTTDEYIDEGPFLITGTDFNVIDGVINWDSCVHVSEWRYDQAPEIQIRNGDLLITKDGTVGKVAIVTDMKDKTTLNSGVMVIRPTEDTYETKFLYYVLKSEEFWKWFNYINSGNTTISHLYQYDLNNFCFAITDKEEQKAISDFLDKKCQQADVIINKVKEQIEILETARRALITECVTKGINEKVDLIETRYSYLKKKPFDWKIKRIKHIILGIKDGTHGTFERLDEGEMLLSAKNVFCDGIHIGSNESLISEADYKSIISNGFPRKGDVLLCCVGTVGRSCVFNEEKAIAFQRSVIFLRPNTEDITSEFLNYALQADYVNAQEQLMINKTAQEGLYMGSVKEIRISIPSTIAEQDEIVSYLNKKCAVIDRIIGKKHSELSILEEQKRSLINEYITGKKRVKEYA
ncbi:MAG: hypothetical protein HDQ95_03595 [Roseburia sp.]|nr:hypothetical protein [Roseburia sp.]